MHDDYDPWNSPPSSASHDLAAAHAKGVEVGRRYERERIARLYDGLLAGAVVDDATRAQLRIFETMLLRGTEAGS